MKVGPKKDGIKVNSFAATSLVPFAPVNFHMAHIYFHTSDTKVVLGADIFS